ncbi:cell division protein ZapA [Oceanobacter kriegii]|uniref:cell division protein ZapA n=1 Tax=Oceanobacter kriegii TaxID=64972 RepID=UPI00042A767D|nr:cell division protein ZapA [Oceanobacter kriegii]
MGSEVNTINLTILERDYRINCPAGAEQQLRNAAHLLDSKMSEIKAASTASGKVPGIDRIAVIAALNIAHQLLEIQTEQHEQEQLISEINQALEDALNESSQREL